MKNIGILGSGIVGTTLADGFIKYGSKVMIGTRSPQKLDEWNEKSVENGSIGSFQETASFGEIVILAVKGTAAMDALKSLDPGSIEGKTVIDATNPISDTPPENGVLNFFTDANKSLMEELQNEFPSANFVKAFSSIGSAHMINPDFGNEKPTMFIGGNSESAKAEVKEILDLFGFETEDMGPAESARAIEPLCILWCIPGFQKNQWSHAFRLLKK